MQEVCPNGKLSRAKFVDLYMTMFPNGGAAAFYQHMFRAYDIDNSGSLDFSEFIQVQRYTVTIYVSPHLQQSYTDSLPNYCILHYRARQLYKNNLYVISVLVKDGISLVFDASCYG